jgi:hypothetical protein
MLDRLPHPPDKQRRRRGVRSRSAARGRRGDYFFHKEVTAAIRSRLVSLGMISQSEADDRAIVRQALDDAINETLHLKK